MKSRIVVIGGNGFIGAEVCRAAVALGHEVVAVARRGRPADGGAWADSVQWIAADLFEPASWTSALVGCDAVVHSIGILKEDPATGATYARMNRDAALLVAGEVEKAKVPAFVFLSAAGKPPGIPAGYLSTKRDVELALAGRPFRAAILRPSLVFGAARPESLGPAKALGFFTRVPILGLFMRNARPLPVELVARAIVHAAVTESVRGVVDIDALKVAGRA